jgi:hypothetical protein
MKTYFHFYIEDMTQAEADALWDKIQEGAEALGHSGKVKGLYKVLEDPPTSPSKESTYANKTP